VAHSNIPTTLKTIEPYRLKALIKEDLKYHPDSSISAIRERLPDTDLKELQKATLTWQKLANLKILFFLQRQKMDIL